MTRNGLEIDGAGVGFEFAPVGWGQAAIGGAREGLDLKAVGAIVGLENAIKLRRAGLVVVDGVAVAFLFDTMRAFFDGVSWYPTRGQDGRRSQPDKSAGAILCAIRSKVSIPVAPLATSSAADSAECHDPATSPLQATNQRPFGAKASMTASPEDAK